MQEIYVSTDVETDGHIPGINSMLSFGSAAFTANKTLLGTFTANIKTLDGAISDPETMEWWKTKPEAWSECRKNQLDASIVMPNYVSWLKNLLGNPVFIGYPASFDFMFVYWYLIRFAGESPFSFSALDIKTYAMAVLKKKYNETTRKKMPREWFDAHPLTHIALDDAISQGTLFCNMLSANNIAK